MVIIVLKIWKLINNKSKEHLKDITICENYIKTIP